MKIVCAIFTKNNKEALPGMIRKDLNIKHFMAVTAIVFLVSACAPRVIFMHEARVRLEEQEVDLSRIQFYNDKDIVLQRKVDSQEYTVKEGVIREIDGRRVQEVRIPRNTNAVIDSTNGGNLYVRFERGDDKLIRFYRNEYDTYQIDADEWIQRQGKIEYAGKDFYITAAGNDALMLVKKTKAYKTMTESHVVSGIKVKTRRRRKNSRLQRKINDLKSDSKNKREDKKGDYWE